MREILQLPRFECYMLELADILISSLSTGAGLNLGDKEHGTGLQMRSCKVG